MDNYERRVYTDTRHGHDVDSIWFHSVRDIMEAKFTLPRNERNFDTATSAKRDPDRWWGSGGMSMALRRINHGWPEGLIMFQNMMRNIATMDHLWPESDLKRRRHKIWAGSGNEVDIHRVYRGQLDKAWRSHKMEEMTAEGHKHVTMLVNFTVNMDTKSDEFLWRGALAAILCERLQALGKSVRIVAHFAAYRTWDSADTDTPYCSMGVTLKDYTAPIVMERLAGQFTVAFLRYHFFRAMDLHPTRVTSWGRGTAIEGAGVEECLPHMVYDEQMRKAATLIFVRDTLSLHGAEREMQRIKRQLSPTVTEQRLYA